MTWCEKHHRTLFVRIHDKALPVTTNVLYQVFSPYGDVEKIARFQTRDDFHTRVNFYFHRDAVHAFYKLQGRQIYNGCCELDLYFASEFICGFKTYIPHYMWDHELSRAPLIPSKLIIRDYRVSSLRIFKKEPTSYLHETDPANYDAYDRGFIIENKGEATLEDENRESDVQVIEHRHLPNIEANDVNNMLLDSMNKEVQFRDYESYANDIHSQGMFILGNNVDAFSGATNAEDVQPLIQVNQESTIIANNSSITPHESSMDIQKFDNMQRKFEMGQVVSVHVDNACIVLDYAFTDNALHSMSKLESEHVDLFISNELLVGKKLHPWIALLFFLEKLKALQFSAMDCIVIFSGKVESPTVFPFAE